MMKILEKLKRALIFPLAGIIFAASSLSLTTPVFADPTPQTPTPAPAITAPITNNQNGNHNPTTTKNNTSTNQNSNTAQSTNQSQAEEKSEEKSEEKKTEEKKTEEKTENASCYSQVGGLGWIVCPVAAFLSRAIDTIYDLIEDFLILEPISMDEKSPVFQIWVYARNITNIIFIIFLMAVIYSQVTGFGLSD